MSKNIHTNPCKNTAAYLSYRIWKAPSSHEHFPFSFVMPRGKVISLHDMAVS